MAQSPSTTANANPTAIKPPIARGVRLRQLTAKATRWLHLYLSMASFAIILFFAVTGLTLNHPTWFANAQKTTAHHGRLPAALLASLPNQPDPDKLAVAEYLRAHEALHGAVSDFRTDDSQITVSWKAPGYTADAFIDRATGKYDLTEVRSGFLAVLNDLHRGAETGAAWHTLIDISALFLIAVSLTGITLLYFVYKHRVAGYLLAAAAAALCLLLYRLAIR